MYWTLNCTPERRDPPPSTRTQTQVPQPGNLDKPLVQSHPQGADNTIKRSHDPPACRKGTPISNLNKMKRQRNTQQVEEHDKNLPNQTKEEIGSLPEKEFRIMIVKMMQNLENKMELQINRLETRIEKMQEKFNKDLEEMKSQSIMNNAITKIKSTLEGMNSRMTDAEDRMSEVEDRMVEINETERKKEKRIEINGDNLRNL